MSHFTVLVIGPDVDEQLGPFHQFECTGLDRFIQDIDVTDERLEEYRGENTSKIKSPDGTLHCPYDDMFYRDPTEEEATQIGPISGTGCGKGISWTTKDWKDGRGYRPKVKFTPDGWEKLEVPTHTLLSFKDWVENDSGTKTVSFGEKPNLENGHKFGFAMLDESGEIAKIVRRTNPNDKWDWYQIGGRWSGLFQLKDGARGKLGDRSLLDKSTDDREELRRADQCLKADKDFDGMRYQAACKANEKYDKYEEIIREFGILRSWTSLRDEIGSDNIDEVRKTYKAQPGINELDEKLGFRMDCWVDQLSCGREAYVQEAERTCFQTYAVLKDGEWFERGEMGWFGMSHNEKDPVEWNGEFLQLIESLPDDTLLTVVDCHI